MFGEDKNLKDTQRGPLKDTPNIPAPYEATGFHLGSYTKINKLITALYMVTDIIDKDEPLRNKLRTLGMEIISDMHTSPSDVLTKISQIMSFLDITSSVNIVSEMNCNILIKEFLKLDQSIKEVTGKIRTPSRQVNLTEFFDEEESKPSLSFGHLSPNSGREILKGHARIGVQKGSTLMKALSDRKLISSIGSAGSNKNTRTTNADGFDILKKQRRNEITNLIKIIGGNATIKDIKDKVKIIPEQAGSLVSCSEKTLQRELVSMVKDGVLNKTGEKRWSRYFLKS